MECCSFGDCSKLHRQMLTSLVLESEHERSLLGVAAMSFFIKHLLSPPWRCTDVEA